MLDPFIRFTHNLSVMANRCAPCSLRYALFPLLILFQSHWTYGQDWTQWRGPNRDGITQINTSDWVFPDSLRLQWRSAIGTGYSSPVVSGKAAFVHTREEDNEVVESYNLSTGQRLWRESYPAPFEQNPYATKHGKGPNSTPLVHGKRIYTFGMSEILSCYHKETGELIWRKDFSQDLDTSRLFCGAGLSPILHKGRLVVHVGDDRGGALVAFDAVSGNEIWRLTGDGPGYSSPIIAVFEGVEQVITLTDGSCIGVDFSNGELLWHLPFADEWNENIVTPIQFKDFLIISGVRQGTMAIKASKNGSQWMTTQEWLNRDLPMYLSSPILSEGRLYGFSSKRKGQYFCMNANSGETIWTSEGRLGFSASVIAAEEQLFLLNTEGELMIAAKDDVEFRPLSRYDVSESSTYAHPVILNNRVLIKDMMSLSLWSFD